MESLAQLELLCERLYNSQDSVEQAHAANILTCFSVNNNYISQCQYILDNASTSYALMMASSSLLKQVTGQSLPLQLRLDIRNYLINYLAIRGPHLEPFVIGSLIELFCRITKYGWFDADNYRNVVKESTDFLNQTKVHFAIGLKILNQLVCEMNQSVGGLSIAQNRGVARSFRDESLHEIFNVSLTILAQLKNDVGSKLQELAMSLSLKCLSFDFMGSIVDESSDDIGTVQIPSSWKQVVEDLSIMHIFFDYYALSKSSVSKEALECLVRLASVRRTLFTSETIKREYLMHLMTGTIEILRTGKGLADNDNYHEFCRLLGRLKSNFQLSELVNVEIYGEWIRLVAELTVKSLQSWKWASNGVYYLLELWSRLVSSLPYSKLDRPSLLDEFVPEIIKCFVALRFDSFQDGDSDLAESPLDNFELLQDQLDCIPHLCRFQYERGSSYITQIIDPVFQLYTELVDPEALAVIETKLAWIVHIIAAIIKMRQFIGYREELQEIHDAELAARVLRLVSVLNGDLHGQRYGEISRQQLDLAILVFFQNFTKFYVRDQAIHTSKKLYAVLYELLGLNDHLVLLNVILGKIATNLKCYRESEVVTNQSLNLLSEMASEYMTGKLLLKLDITHSVISNHNREQFSFLADHYSHSRTTFYYIVGSLILIEDSLPKFKSSMSPLLQVFVTLESTPDTMFRAEITKQLFVGLMRDLRGIAMAMSSRRAYGFLFDWLYPTHMPLLLKAITVWADTPEVTTPLLKFMAELMLNKSQRLNFEKSSPNAILLLREISKIIVAYGSRMLHLPNQSNMYQFKYKGTWISLTILSNALAGNYINFPMFETYDDRALVDVLDIALRMTLSIPSADILAYRKLAGAYFTFLDLVSKNQIFFILNLDSSSFMYIVGSIESGLKMLDANTISQCASAVDNLATFYFESISNADPDSPSPAVATSLARHFTNCSHILFEILKTLFEIVLFEDCGNHWNISKPMLSLMLFSQEMFTSVKAQLLASQPVDRHEHISLCFDKLMSGISRSLDQKNRLQFSSNLARFRNDFRTK